MNLRIAQTGENIPESTVERPVLGMSTTPDNSRHPRRTLRIATRAMPLELLFDLVFLFTVTQVTHLIVEHPDALGIARAFVLLVLVYFMYDGYIWLMNQIAADVDHTIVRVLMIAAMAAFLVLAAALPHAFDSTRLVFGIAYLAAVVIHASLFATLGSRNNLRAILRAAPANALAALILIVAAFVDEPIADWLPVLAVLVIVASVVFRRMEGFDLGASHLIERHGLLMIIVFGESIVGVGLGMSEHELDLGTVLSGILAVGIVGGMWWSYFSYVEADDTERRIGRRPTGDRSSLVIRAYFIDHLLMMFGLVLFAAGIRPAFEGVLAAASPASAFLMSGGLGLYLFAQAAYRVELGVGVLLPRIAGGIVATAAGILGTTVNPLVELAGLLLVIVGVNIGAWYTVQRGPAPSP
jgi:low temperature requirement protein LtrA